MGEYRIFTEKIHHAFGVDLARYKEAQMKRRLTSLRNQRGYPTFSAYYEALIQHQQLQEEFIDRLTINVTEFYRNPNRWQVLQDIIIPHIKKGKHKLTVWSAACSTGEEPYSIAMIFKEHFKDIQVDILATDLDEKVLERAKQGQYKAQALKSLPEDKKSKYFMFKDNTYTIHEDIKSIVRFKRHNLLKDPYPAKIDLIVCRNVLIYFTDEAKEFIYQNFSDSLVEKGFLFVGSTEQIFNSDRFYLSLYDTFFYQKGTEKINEMRNQDALPNFR